jgi:hypothetical protein
VDRFVSYTNKQVTHYNAKCRDGISETVDSLQLSYLD